MTLRRLPWKRRRLVWVIGVLAGIVFGLTQPARAAADPNPMDAARRAWWQQARAAFDYTALAALIK